MYKNFDELVNIIKALRAPDGCPWDKKQTHHTIIKNMREECEEAVAAIENNDDENLKEELGDVLLQVVFHAVMAQERGAFDINDVIEAVNSKLVRRHPHVFGDKKAANEEEALERWREVKAQEKAAAAKK